MRSQLAAARRPRRALHELLADQRLGLDRAVGVGAKRREPAVELHLHPRAPVLREPDADDASDLGPGDLDVLARDQVGGVVEQRVDAIARPARAAEPRRQQRRRADRHQARDDAEASHGESCLRQGASGVYQGLDPSGADCVPAPGQRATRPLRKLERVPCGFV